MSARLLCVLISVYGALVLSSTFGQTDLADNPKLSEHFSFGLGPRRDQAVSALTTTLIQRDKLLRARELEEANATVFTRVLDLLRFVPIQLSSGASDEFLTPNYLRPGYAARPEPHLFDGPDSH
jgi:hypothetical protein